MSRGRARVISRSPDRLIQSAPRRRRAPGRHNAEDPDMRRLARALAVLVLALSPGLAAAGPAGDGNPGIGRWADAFTANHPEGLAEPYAPDAAPPATSTTLMSQGVGAGPRALAPPRTSC